MNVHRSIAMVSLFAAALAIATPVSDGYTLKHEYHEGDTSTYKTVGKFEVMGTTAELNSTADIKVLKVEADGTVTTQSTPTENVLKIGENVIPAPRMTQVTVINPDGNIKEIRGEATNATSYRMWNLINFFAPPQAVKVGDTWVHTVKADTALETVAVKVSYKVVAEETVGKYDTVKVESTAVETDSPDGAVIKATIWINKADAVLIKTEAKWTNVTVPGAPQPISGSMVTTREEKA